MIVCSCVSVTSDDIDKEIENGITEIDDLIERLGVCTGCGTCRSYIEGKVCNKQ